jgi:putative phosphoribosyl transferase
MIFCILAQALYCITIKDMNTLFRDRKHAAEELVKILDHTVIINDMREIIVLAIPRGGIIIGDIIASHFHCNLDIVVSRKIGAEFNPEFAIGAVMPDDNDDNDDNDDYSYFINERITKLIPPVSRNYIDNQIKTETKEIARLLMEYRGSKFYNDKLEGKIVISR